MKLDPANVRILLVDVAPRLLTAFPESASNYARKELESMGVDDRTRAIGDRGRGARHPLQPTASAWKRGPSSGRRGVTASRNNC
jgi:hypothetical protein